MAATVPFQYDDLTRLPDGPHIRLLTILPASDRLQKVKCNLVTQSLDDARDYIALSYVWGDVADKQLIECNGCDLRVTRNLLTVLHHLRQSEQAVLFWIDAICINQEDLAERASQVSHMGRVYSGAAFTLVWLGEETRHTESAIEVYTRLAEKQVGWNDSASDLLDSVRFDPRDFSAIRDILDRPWWSRVWVIQELCLSTDILIQIGTRAVPWTTMNYALLFILLLWRQSGSGNVISIDNNDSLFHANALLAITYHPNFQTARMMARTREIIQEIITQSESRHNAINQDLLEILLRFQNFQATDNRDKIFALLGVASNSSHGVQIDYVTTVRDCYIQTAKSIVRATRNVSIFNAVISLDPARDTTLPSWVPHWNRTATDSTALDVDAAREHIVRESQELNDTKPRFKPARNTLTDSDLSRLELPDDPDVLNLPGIVVDSITATTEVLPAPIQGRRTTVLVDTSLDISLPVVDSSSPDFNINAGITVENLARFRRFAGCSVNGDERPWRVLVATLSFGEALRWLNSQASELKSQWSAAVPGEGTAVLRAAGSLLRPLSWSLYRAKLGRLFWRYSVSRQTAMVVLTATITNAFGRRLAKTQNGRLALVPASVRTGDRIVLLAGGKTPYVIRQKGAQRWQLLGECYVHGIMFGEAWREDLCQEMQFV